MGSSDVDANEPVNKAPGSAISWNSKANCSASGVTLYENAGAFSGWLSDKCSDCTVESNSAGSAGEAGDESCKLAEVSSDDSVWSGTADSGSGCLGMSGADECECRGEFDSLYKV